MTKRDRQFELEKAKLFSAIREHQDRTGHPKCEIEFDEIKGKFGLVECCSCKEIVFFSGTGQDN